MSEITELIKFPLKYESYAQAIEDAMGYTVLEVFGGDDVERIGEWVAEKLNEAAQER